MRRYGAQRQEYMAAPSTAGTPTTGAPSSDTCEFVDSASGAIGGESSRPSSPVEAAPPPLRSVHTSNFSAMLQELGISILVTTYQAGKLVMLRPDGERLNTHFRSFSKPMGLAVHGDRLALGTSLEIWEFHNAPAVARRLDPAGSHDACFLPRSSVCTGDIQIHEMAFARVEGGRAAVMGGGWTVEGEDSSDSPFTLHSRPTANPSSPSTLHAGPRAVFRQHSVLVPVHAE
jgi:hypothetical protein